MLTPEEKAQELFERFRRRVFTHREAIACALIAVDELIETVGMCIPFMHEHTFVEFWEEVKQEIEKL
jgi:hypothetical protein